MMVGTGCGVPGVMASRTIENERDRRMTIMTTTFIPCGAKLPIIGLIAGALFGNSALIGWSAYVVGIAAIVISGIILKKTKMFAGDPAPFVMELPAYHIPTFSSVFHSVWERASSFVKKAGTVILLATILVWFMSSFGFYEGAFQMLPEEDFMEHSILAALGNTVAWIFAPLGWGSWKPAVAAVTGLIAKENVVGTFGILYKYGEVSEMGEEIWANLQADMSALAGYSFLVFNHQERDEQRQVDMVRDRLSVRFRLSGILVHLSDRQRCYRQYEHYWPDRIPGSPWRNSLYAVQAL